MNKLKQITLTATVLMLAGCATNIHRPEAEADPYEKMNRKIFAVNEKVYENVYFPIIRGYRKITTPDIRERVYSFVANVREPVSTINYVLQLKPKETAVSVTRLGINTTLGLGGLFDVASSISYPG